MAIHANDDGAPNAITYLFTDLSGNRIEELPLDSASFSLKMNGAGSFAGTLKVEDPRVQATNWINATAPNLTCVWVDISGTLVFGGLVNRRNYTRKAGSVQITANDHAWYLQRRLQAADYSTTWATTATGAATIARQVIADALAVNQSLSFSLSTPAVTPSQYGITLAAPISQRMTVDAIVNQLSNLGWLVGFDYAVDVAYVAGVPTATLTLSYPRRGRIAGSTGLQMDVTAAIDFTYEEQGDNQATKVTETASGVGGIATSGSWDPANTTNGYPLLERIGSHISFSPSATPQTVTDAWIANDLALTAYPAAVPKVTMPMFAEPAIGEWIVGDDLRLIVPSATGEYVTSGTYPGSSTFPGSSTTPGTVVKPANGSPADPRFPSGMDFYWRIVQADCVIPSEGIPTVVYTFNAPPSSTPQQPPQ